MSGARDPRLVKTMFIAMLVKKQNSRRNLTALSHFVENFVISTPAWLISVMVYDKD